MERVRAANLLRGSKNVGMQPVDIQHLRRLSANELQGLKTAPANAFDRSARIVLRAGEELTPAVLRRLRGRRIWPLFVPPEWDAGGRSQRSLGVRGSDANGTASNVTVADTDLSRGRDDGDAAEIIDEFSPYALPDRTRRKHDRFVWNGPVRVVIGNADSRRERGVLVEACDISGEGFAFLYGRFLHPGTEVCAVVGDLTPLRGRVVDCVYTGDGMHRVCVRLTARRATGAAGDGRCVPFAGTAFSGDGA